MKKRKSLTLSALEKKLDKEFSDYVRRKDADEGGTVSCVTCNRLFFWREVHCGHFVKRQYRSIRWNPLNCAPQCISCNTYKGGRQDDYGWKIIKKYGNDVHDDLMQKKYQTFKVTRPWIEEEIEKYKELNRELDKRLPRKD